MLIYVQWVNYRRTDRRATQNYSSKPHKFNFLLDFFRILTFFSIFDTLFVTSSKFTLNLISNSQQLPKIQYYIFFTRVRQNAVRTSLDFPGLPRTFTNFCGNYTRWSHLDHKKSNIWSYLVSFENFHFFQFLAKIGHKWKNHKK